MNTNGLLALLEKYAVRLLDGRTSGSTAVDCFDLEDDFQCLMADPKINALHKRQIRTAIQWGLYDEVRLKKPSLGRFFLGSFEHREHEIRKYCGMGGCRVVEGQGIELQQRTGVQLFVLSGLPGSGKSTWIEKVLKFERRDIKVISTDAIRVELCGNEQDQSANRRVFEIAHERTRKFLREGNSVVFDATGILHSHRMAVLQIGFELDVFTTTVVFDIPFRICLERNQRRARIVPEHVMNRFFMQWERPSYDEADDRYIVTYTGGK